MDESRQEILLIGDFNIDMLVREHGDDPENNSLMDFCDRNTWTDKGNWKNNDFTWRYSR